MEIVAGLNLNSIEPRVWDATSDYHLSKLDAVMVSYAYFHQSPRRCSLAMEIGLHASLNIPEHVKIYLDNGAFKFSRDGNEVPREKYKEFVETAKPDWHVIPQDYIPAPHMNDDEQLECLQKTMEVNQRYSHDGYVPILHISRHLGEYLRQFEENEKLWKKTSCAIGGIVPNLLRAPKAMSHGEILDKVYQIREKLANRKLHLFGVGGTATLHVAALLGMDSVDSVGWRVRAAHGLVQLPGIGDRHVATKLGTWKIREPSLQEFKKLEKCLCPACKQHGRAGLEAKGTEGFCNRATHNLWTLLEENRKIQKHLKDGTYEKWYEKHLHNSTYRPLIDRLVEKRLK